MPDSKVTPTRRAARAIMTTSASPLLRERRFLSSKGGGMGNPAPVGRVVVYGCEVAVMPELKCEGDISDWGKV